jgi:hypothetical protein
MPNLSTFKATIARGGCEVHWASRAYQLESSDGAAGTQGVGSAALGAETAEGSAEIVELLWLVLILLLLAITSCRDSWTERGS